MFWIGLDAGRELHWAYAYIKFHSLDCKLKKTSLHLNKHLNKNKSGISNKKRCNQWSTETNITDILSKTENRWSKTLRSTHPLSRSKCSLLVPPNAPIYRRRLWVSSYAPDALLRLDRPNSCSFGNIVIGWHISNQCSLYC
jgi:hypothetical protein